MPMELSHIWLGHFPSEEEFEQYFKEIYGEDEEYDDLYRDVDDDEGDDEDAADAELHEEGAARDANDEYADDGDELPINKFAEEQGETFYDDDRLERSFHDSRTLRELIAGHTSSEDYIEQVISYAESQGLSEVNVFIIADKEEFETPRAVNGDRHTLWYIGEFGCRI